MGRELELDERLQKIAGYVRPGAVFADVGCDHGRLSVYLMQKCGAEKGFACDIRPQPLEKARLLIEKTGLIEKIIPVLTDGLHGMEGRGITDVVIAGIGGEVLAKIVEETSFLQDHSIRVILQPQSREPVLRKALYRCGFDILEEQVVASGRFLYTILVAEYSGEKKEISDYTAHTGLLPRNKDELTREKLRRTARILMDIVRGMEDAPQMKEEAQRLRELADRIEKTAGL